jgi:CubicO group peptidase (beta-lactamase class C family)
MRVSTHLDAHSIAAVIEPHFAAAIGEGLAPGLAYGVIHDGQLVMHAGLGQRRPEDSERAPDADSSFRIASMTKSFTAATVLSLRDDGLLTLDDPVHEHVPEVLAGGRSARTITVRHLLSMGGGFLTDDPWGDRQQDLTVEAFRALLASGVPPALRPGEVFEYSNLGYAILGLVLESVTSMPFAQVVDMRVLAPMDLGSTAFTPRSGADVVPGYVRRSAGWVEEPLAAHGAFSPMGGLFSTVSDLARWVTLMQSVHSGTELPGVPLTDTSLREMQRTQRLAGATAGPGKDLGGDAPVVTGYGFGLFEEFGPAGRFVFHSGGYPGFGSHMRWHPASGLGIVALANATYAPMSTIATRALRELVLASDVSRHAQSPDLPGLENARSAVLRWLMADRADGAEAAALRELFADNVERDVPWSERILQWEQVRQGGPPVVRGESRPSPGAVLLELGHADPRWRLTVMVSPHDQRLVQSVSLRAVPADAPEAPASTVLS